MTSPLLNETEHQRFRRGGRRRLIWATVIALVILVLLVIFGPGKNEIERRFEVSGEQGPLRIMPELSIDRGVDAHHQDELRRTLELPIPAPEYEIEYDDPDATEIVPIKTEDSPELEKVIDPTEDPELDVVDMVEMRLPSQSNPCFRLVQMVRPRYPAEATALERQQPVITVHVAFFVSLEGSVQGAYIMTNDGGPAFADVTLKAVEQWVYEPVECEFAPAGFWVNFPLEFTSPMIGY
jgi:hypothetical protein